MKGIGVDIIAIERIKEIYDAKPQAFSKRVLSADELKKLTSVDDKPRFIAKRFAAKEAFVKAVGTGVRVPYLLAGIDVENNKLGKPYFRFNETIQKELQQAQFGEVHLSISDSHSYVIAMVAID